MLHFITKKDSLKLEKLQERGLRTVYHDYVSDYEALLAKCNLKTLRETRLQSIVTEVYKSQNDSSPEYIQNMFQPNDTGYASTRTDQLKLQNRRTKSYGIQTFSHTGAVLWNKLPNSIKCHSELKSFKSDLSKISISKIDDSRVTN